MRIAKTKTISTDIEIQALHSEKSNAHPLRPSLTGFLNSTMRSRHPKWKVGIQYCAFAGSFVFLLNTVLLIVGESRAGFPSLTSNDGKRILYEGQCNTTKKINIGLHLVINVLSTILLGASNYCMQCMSAPTRAEAQQAHAKFEWVDIGVPSIRNLKRIRRLRVVLWLLLGASSMPLHLL
jgi:hypothetical protein